MATSKGTRSRTPRKEVPYRQVLVFPQVKGKIMTAVELGTAPDENSLTLFFEDKTALCFDMEPCLTVMPEFANVEGDWKKLKRWPAIHSRTFTVWP